MDRRSFVTPVEAAKQKLVEVGAAAQVNPEKAQEFHDSYQEFMNTVSKAQSSAEVQDAFQKAQDSFQEAQRKAYLFQQALQALQNDKQLPLV